MISFIQTLIEAIKTIFFWVIGSVQTISSTIANGEPLVKGLVTVAILSSVVFLCKNVPQQVFFFLLKRISLTVIYRKPFEEDKTTTEVYAYNQLTSYLAKLTKARSFTLDRKINTQSGNALEDTISFGIGETNGIFFTKGKFFFFHRTINTGDKNTPPTDQVQLRVFFGTQDDIKNIIPPAEKDTKRYSYIPDLWRHHSDSPLTQLPEDLEIFLPHLLKSQIDNAISYFLENKAEMLSRGIPWKLTFMFYGPPGTGKSTLLSYIAKKLHKSITIIVGQYGINLYSKANKNNSVLALEDLDCLSFTGKRKKGKTTDTDEQNKNTEQEQVSGDLSQLLNYLQGPIPLNGDVTVITTNHIEKLDPAIYRPGRVDHLIFVDFYGIDDVVDWVKFFYREDYDHSLFPAFDPEMKFRPGDLAELYRKHSKDLAGFFTALQERCLSLQEKSDEDAQEEEREQLFKKAMEASAKIVIKKAEIALA